MGRYRLLEAMLKSRDDLHFFAVGDDWQSIYRFAGSDICFVRNFSQIFGATATVALDTTFRFNDRIGDVASRFVLQNPEQVTKSIDSLAHSEEPAVSLVCVREESSGLALALQAIEERAANIILLQRKFEKEGEDGPHIRTNRGAFFIEKNADGEADVKVRVQFKDGRFEIREEELT